MVPRHPSLACDPGRRSLPASAASNRRPPGRPHPQAGEKTNTHRRTNIHKSYIAPVNGVPTEDIPIDLPAHRIDAVEVAKVGDEEADEQSAPDLEFGRCAQDEGFVEGETEVEVR